MKTNQELESKKSILLWEIEHYKEALVHQNTEREKEAISRQIEKIKQKIFNINWRLQWF